MKLALVRFSTLATAIIALLLLPGCGKKSAEATVEKTAPTEIPAAAQPAQPAPAHAVAPDTRLAESQAAINSRDYERAAATLVAVQQTQLNEQQAAVVAKQMRDLQSSLASAVASGDARAKAAAEKLRQSATVR